jgi:hypothetical protein
MQRLFSLLAVVVLSLGLVACKFGSSSNTGTPASSGGPQQLNWDQGNWNQANWQ